MRNYLDPEMSIVMFDAENVVTDASGLKNAATEQYFSQETGSDAIRAKTVAVGNILNFTTTQ